MRHPSIKAAIRLAPARSQVFVLALTLGGLVSIFISFALLWQGHSQWPVPLVVGTVLLVPAWIAWQQSHRDIDRHGAHPVQISDARSGIAMSMDAQSLNSQDTRKLFARIVDTIANRKPLPEPDGLVDADKQPLENSKASAIEQVRTINAQVLGMEECAIASSLQKRSPVVGVEQRASSELPPTG